MQHSNVNLRIRLAHDDNLVTDAQGIAKLVAEVLVAFNVVPNITGGPVVQTGRKAFAGAEDGPNVEVFLQSAAITMVTPRG